MKKHRTFLKAIALLAALMASASAFAQTEILSDILETAGTSGAAVTAGTAGKAKSSFAGIIAGLNFSGDPDSKMNRYHVGVVTRMGLPLGLSLQPGILYNVKGSTIKGAIKGADLSTSVGYLEVPVQIQWGIKIKNFRPYIFGEPFVGYGINAKNVLHYQDAIRNLVGNLVTEEGKVEEGKVEEIKGNLTSRLEYGFSAGAGLQYGIVQLSAKMFWNLGNLYNEEGKLEDVTQSISSALRDIKGSKNVSGFAVSLAVFF